MNIQTHYDKTNHIRSHVLTGEVSIPKLIEQLTAIYNSADIPIHANVIWDISAADLSTLSSQQMGELTQFITVAWEESKNYRAAFIVDSDVNFGMARMFEQSLDLFNNSYIQVFRSREPAFQWIVDGE